MRILVALLGLLASGVLSAQAQEQAKRRNQIEMQIETPFEKLTIKGESGCKIENEWPNVSNDIRWLGECKDGVAHGRGVARWYKDGLKALEIVYSGTNGLIRNGGKAAIEKSQISKRIKMTMGSCDRGIGYRAVRVEPDPRLALHHNWVVSYILAEHAQKLAWDKCPASGYSNVDVNFYINGNRIIHARSYPPVEGPQNPYKTNWSEFSNHVQQDYLHRHEQAFRQESHQRQLELQKKAQERARLQAEQQKQQADAAKRAARDTIIGMYGVQRFTNEQQLHTNPFMFKDQVIGVHTAFGRMISANEAIFMFDGIGATALIVTNVPSTRFSAKSPVILAIRVIGTKAFKTGAGEVMLPHGEYIGVHFCSQPSCPEIF
jgi:hypothetical protein